MASYTIYQKKDALLQTLIYSILYEIICDSQKISR